MCLSLPDFIQTYVRIYIRGVALGGQGWRWEKLFSIHHNCSLVQILQRNKKIAWRKYSIRSIIASLQDSSAQHQASPNLPLPKHWL